MEFNQRDLEAVASSRNHRNQSRSIYLLMTIFALPAIILIGVLGDAGVILAAILFIIFMFIFVKRIRNDTRANIEEAKRLFESLPDELKINA